MNPQQTEDHTSSRIFCGLDIDFRVTDIDSRFNRHFQLFEGGEDSIGSRFFVDAILFTDRHQHQSVEIGIAQLFDRSIKLVGDDSDRDALYSQLAQQLNDSIIWRSMDWQWAA